jgi:hypothetical protein
MYYCETGKSYQANFLLVKEDSLIPGNEMRSETLKATFHKCRSCYCNSRKREYFAVKGMRDVSSGGLYQIPLFLIVL